MDSITSPESLNRVVSADAKPDARTTAQRQRRGKKKASRKGNNAVDTHPSRKEIINALAGGESYKSIVESFSTPVHKLTTHTLKYYYQQRLLPSIKEAQEEIDKENITVFTDRLNAAFDMTTNAIQIAQENGNLKVVVDAIGKLNEQIRMTGESDGSLAKNNQVQVPQNTHQIAINLGDVAVMPMVDEHGRISDRGVNRGNKGAVMVDPSQWEGVD